MSQDSNNNTDDVMETLKRLAAEQQERLSKKVQWTEELRDNVRDGGMVNKPGEKK